MSKPTIRAVRLAAAHEGIAEMVLEMLFLKPRSNKVLVLPRSDRVTALLPLLMTCRL